MSDSLHHNTKAAIDDYAGAGTANQAEGKAREVIGQGQQAVGEAIGNKHLQTEGATTELEGKAQQVGGLLQEHAQETVEKAKAGIGRALDNVKDTLDGRDDNTVR